MIDQVAKLSEAESLRAVLESIRAECDPVALMEAGGYLFRYVANQRLELQATRDELLKVKAEASEQAAKLSLLIQSVEAVLNKADMEGIQKWHCVRALRKALEAAK